MATKESQSIEWKRAWQSDYLKWICGFANAQGGRMYIGKDDNGRVVGLKNAEKLLENLPNTIQNKLGLMPQINLLEKAGKDYLEIVIEPSKVAISFQGKYYRRSGSVTQEIAGPELNNFLLEKMGTTWDRMIEEQATFEDIDEATIDMFRKQAVRAGRLSNTENLSNEELLRKLHLLTKNGLTNAALVLFGKDPGEFYPNLFVKIGRFGLSVVDIRFQEVCEGNLFQLLHDVMEQLERKFLVRPIRFERLRRIEELEYPVSALREMLLNALIHRNYMGSMTQLKVMDNGISLWNAGGLPLELTINKLFQTHESIPRNPLIAEVCYRAGYIDSWGRGIEKITTACKQAGLSRPTIIERSGGILVELKKPSDSEYTVSENNVTYFEDDIWERVGKESGKSRERVGKESGKSRERVGKESGKSRERVGKESKKILDICQENPSITIPEMAETIGITERSIQRNIQKLQSVGLLLRVGGRKQGHWEVIENNDV